MRDPEASNVCLSKEGGVMTGYKMEVVPYSEHEMWESYDDGRVRRKLRELLCCKNKLIVITHGDPPYVVLGVPHQAANGVEKICEDVGCRDSDESAAFYALPTFRSLQQKEDMSCKLVIAAHPSDHDPNKEEGSPYFAEALTECWRLLVEFHGAACHRKHGVEVTGGKNRLSNRQQFMDALLKALRQKQEAVAAEPEIESLLLAVQETPGSKQATVYPLAEREKQRPGCLVNPANKTESLIEAWRQGLQAIHIEAKPRFRKAQDEGGERTTPLGHWLGKAIGEAICEILQAC